MSIDKMFGKEFLDYIEVQQKEGKNYEDIALEHGKTKEAIRSKVKREKQKVNKGVVQKRVPKEVHDKIVEVQNEPQEIEEKLQNIPQKKVQSKKATEEDTNLKNIINLLEKIERNTANTATLSSIQIADNSFKHKLKIPYKFGETFSTSIRVDKNIWEEFKEFSKENKHIKQQDLVSLALKEFLEKYKN